MNFAFTEEQVALRDLAREILEKEISPERLGRIEADEEWFAREAWGRLGEANLLGLAIPEARGGMGFGEVELCLLLREVGRAVVPLPAFASLVLGALPIARHGGEAQQRRWLPGVAEGRTLLTGAWVDADSAQPERPATRARRDGADWRLEGRKLHVPWAHLAERVLVPAADEHGPALFLVDPAASGVARRTRRISTREPLTDLELDGARAREEDRLAAGPEALGRLWDAALVALAATQLGVSERALEITTAYLRQRHQFGAPIGSFPPVQHRAADGYIDLEALRWTTWRAAWRLSRGLPGRREALVAKYWAAEAGSRIANSAQHLHGGIGVDRDYPIHRYFLWSKALELQLGGALPQLARLGADMARRGPREET